MIRMHVTGSQALLSLIGLHARYLLGLGHGAEMAGQLLVRTTHEGMQSAGGGRLHRGARRQAGAPGGYPAVQSGQLLGSIDYTVHGVSRLEFGSRGAFNRGYNYAIGIHESNARVPDPRPYLTLSVNKRRAEIARLLGDTVYRKIVGG